MNRRFLTTIFLSYFVLFSLLANARAESSEKVGAEEPSEQEVNEGHGLVLGALLYVPNRVFDLLDIFRFRVRVGPGAAVSARVTSAVSLYLGSYATLFAGLPGPRLDPSVPLPVGLESHNGATVSVVDATADGGVGPDYSSTEVGLGAQILIVGFDFGIDPLEIIDFVTGILTIDIREDDL